MSLDRMLTLAGVDKKQEAINALKLSKQQLVEAYDHAIKQAESGVPLDEGLMTGLRAAIATMASGTVKATKSIARQAAGLGDNIKKLYLDEKAKLELKDMLKGMVTIAGEFEKLEKSAPTIIKKDERVRQIVKVFRDAMETMLNDLKARALPPDRVEPSMAESEVIELLAQFLAEEASLAEEISYDRAKTAKAAADLEKAIKARFHVPIDTTTEKDGSITFKLNKGHLTPKDSNPHVLTPAGLSEVIDKMYQEFRDKGWTFTQPVKGEFTIGVK